MKANKKRLVLIAEDERPMERLLVEEFGKTGLDIEVARDGADALALALRTHPDIILLDIVMPKMDGLTMLKKLREDAWGKNVPVILLTNFGDTDKIVEATKSGAYGYLLKSSWDVSDVVKKVQEALNSH